MKFNKFEKLINSYDVKTVSEFLEYVPPDLGWVVTEKIHGANFQFKSIRPVDGPVSLMVGKRTGFTDTNFFKLEGSEEFLKVQGKVLEAMQDLYNIDDTINDIEIIGEVFGSNIQKGIFYSRSKRFIAFNIRINNVLVDHHTFIRITEGYDIPTVPILCVGTIDICLKVSNTFDSLLPSIYGETAPEGDNICEGVVIAPIVPYFLPSGTRVALKSKNDIWSEKASIKKTKQRDPLEGNELKIYTLLSGLVDENRIESAISKIGSEMQLIPKLLEEVNTDILLSTQESQYEPYLKDITVDLTKDNTNKIRRLLSKRIVNLIKNSIRGRMDD